MRRRRGITPAAVVGLGLALGAGLGPAAARAQNRRVRDVARSAGRALEVAAEARQREKRTERYDPTFRKYSKRYFGVGFDWRYFKAQGMAESGLDPTARSPVGARGVMQLMPATYRLIQSARPEFRAIDDPEWNIAAGILHDRDLWMAWERRVPERERWSFVVGSYNAGEGTILRARRVAQDAKLEPSLWRSIESVAPTVDRWRYRETLGYVRTIDSNYRALVPATR